MSERRDAGALRVASNGCLKAPELQQDSDNNHLSLPTTPVVQGSSHPCNQLQGNLGGQLVGKYLDACWAEATKHAYSGDMRDFAAWGGGVPASADIVARYIAERATSLAPATLARRLAGVGALHVSAGFQDPTKNPLVRMVLRGVRRKHGVAQRCAQPIDPRKWVRAWTASGGLRGARDKAVVLLGFSAAFRRSELVGLNAEDLSWSSHGLSVRLRKAKTDQEGKSRTIAVPWVDEEYCAARAVKEWIAAGKIEKGALFRSIDRQGRLGARLHAQSVNLIVKRLAEVEGLSADMVSGHSLRAGFVTEAAKAGADLTSIRRQTGHASLDMLARYMRDMTQFFGNANSWLGRIAACPTGGNHGPRELLIAPQSGSPDTDR